MTTNIAILALVISVASFAFSVYQYYILHSVRISEKATAVLRLTNDMRRKSEDLKHLINKTDHVDDCAEFIAKVNTLVELHATKIATSKKTDLATLVAIEHILMPLDLEIDLLQKQVVEVGNFNIEVQKHEASMRVLNEP